MRKNYLQDPNELNEEPRDFILSWELAETDEEITFDDKFNVDLCEVVSQEF